MNEIEEFKEHLIEILEETGNLSKDDIEQCYAGCFEKKVKTNKYRVIRDKYAGYEAQIKRWWFPFWLQISVSTSSTVEGAVKTCKNHHNKVVKYIDYGKDEL